MAWGGGPTKVTPAEEHARAKLAFSDRKPYPGCNACAWHRWGRKCGESCRVLVRRRFYSRKARYSIRTLWCCGRMLVFVVIYVRKYSSIAAVANCTTCGALKIQQSISSAHIFISAICSGEGTLSLGYIMVLYSSQRYIKSAASAASRTRLTSTHTRQQLSTKPIDV